MSKPPVHTLIWSEESQSYELRSHDQLEQRFGPDGEERWLTWLASHASFSFQGRSGRMSVLKEARQRGAGYWYAYRSHGRHTMKRYLGRTSDLSLARLEEAAHFLESLSSSQQHPLQPNREIALSQPAPRVPRVLHAQPPSSESLLPLLISKLSPPRLPALLVERARLLARLDTGCLYTLTLLLAPAGFGKTTLAISGEPPTKPPDGRVLSYLLVPYTSH